MPRREFDDCACAGFAWAFVALLHPLIGVVAMVTSSLSVIVHSLRLKRAKLTVKR